MKRDDEAVNVIVPGRVVISRNGRDKGIRFIVISSENNYVYISDGVLRKLERQKKKKIVHVRLTNAVHDLSAYKKTGLKDSDIRRLLLKDDEASEQI